MEMIQALHERWETLSQPHVSTKNFPKAPQKQDGKIYLIFSRREDQTASTSVLS